MNLTISAITIILYFLVLLVLSHFTARDSSNENFFRAGRKSPWPLVAFGMIGASVSGVSFVSVPGYVGFIQMTYLQMCIGFFFGYLLVAYVLLPIYYKHNLTTIYSYLQQRFGTVSHKTGASFFLLSKITGAAARFYLACVILQQFVFEPLGIPYFATIIIVLLMVWLYTRRSGIRTIVYTDCFQTLCLLVALVVVTMLVASRLYASPSEMFDSLTTDSFSRIFVFDDWGSKQNFWKQFISGIFIVVVMTGLDQDMMQKNLTCKSLKSSQKNMCLYGISFVPVNFILLVLGVMLYSVAQTDFAGQNLQGDALFPTIVQSGYFGYPVLVLFLLGIIAAAFSSVDSALTALTTTVCIDILSIEDNNNTTKPKKNKNPEKTRRITHLVIVAIFVLFALAFKAINSNSVIDAIYTLASYTYGPLLGLFAFGLFTKRNLRERYMPIIAVLSPLICYVMSVVGPMYFNYSFGYELLLINGLLTFGGLYLLSYKGRESSITPCQS